MPGLSQRRSSYVGQRLSPCGRELASFAPNTRRDVLRCLGRRAIQDDCRQCYTLLPSLQLTRDRYAMKRQTRGCADDLEKQDDLMRLWHRPGRGTRKRHQAGESVQWIARAHKRSPRAIELRLQRLGVLPSEKSFARDRRAVCREQRVLHRNQPYVPGTKYSAQAFEESA